MRVSSNQPRSSVILVTGEEGKRISSAVEMQQVATKGRKRAVRGGRKGEKRAWGERKMKGRGRGRFDSPRNGNGTNHPRPIVIFARLVSPNQIGNSGRDRLCCARRRVRLPVFSRGFEARELNRNFFCFCFVDKKEFQCCQTSISVKHVCFFLLNHEQRKIKWNQQKF